MSKHRKQPTLVMRVTSLKNTAQRAKERLLLIQRDELKYQNEGWKRILKRAKDGI